MTINIWFLSEKTKELFRFDYRTLFYGNIFDIGEKRKIWKELEFFMKESGYNLPQ